MIETPAPAAYSATVNVNRQTTGRARVVQAFVEVLIDGPDGKPCQFDPSSVMLSLDGTKLYVALKEQA